MSTRLELAHDFVVAVEAGDWRRANELVPQTAPLHKQLEVQFLGRDGDTIYVSASGWRPGDNRVVIKHAQILLSEEFRSDVDDD